MKRIIKIGTVIFSIMSVLLTILYNKAQSNKDYAAAGGRCIDRKMVYTEIERIGFCKDAVTGALYEVPPAPPKPVKTKEKKED